MKATGGFVKVTNKIIGEDGQTTYFTEKELEIIRGLISDAMATPELPKELKVRSWNPEDMEEWFKNIEKHDKNLQEKRIKDGERARELKSQGLYDYSWVAPMTKSMWESLKAQRDKMICRDKCEELTGYKNMMCFVCRNNKEENKLNESTTTTNS